MNPIKKPNPLVLVFIACIVSRLPQLISPDLRLDSDECVVALMTKHMYLGKEFPIFFWGQYYGFSLIEEFAIIPFYVVLGVTAMAVKLGMLMLWSAGILFFYKALIHITGNKQNSFLLTLLFIVTPAWALWSMKARGGYLTSHLLSCIALYLLFHKDLGKKNITYLFIGVLLYFIYQSQPFWLAGLIPLIGYKLIKEKDLIKPLLMAIATIALYFAIQPYKQGLYLTYSVGPIDLNWDNVRGQITRFPSYLTTSLNGTYHFSWPRTPFLVSSLFAIIFGALFIMLFINGIAQAFNFKKYNGQTFLFICSTLFIPLTFGYSLFSTEMEYRYLLPITMYSLLSLSVFIGSEPFPRLAIINLIGVIVIGCLSLATFWKSQYIRSERVPLMRAINYLQKNDIHYVYCADYTFQWEIMFITNEKILARFFKSYGRYPKYDSLVDMALYTGKKTAVLGHSGNPFFGEHYNHYDWDSVYYISVNQPQDSLKPLFDFHTPRP